MFLSPIIGDLFSAYRTYDALLVKPFGEAYTTKQRVSQSALAPMSWLNTHIKHIGLINDPALKKSANHFTKEWRQVDVNLF